MLFPRHSRWLAVLSALTVALPTAFGTAYANEPAGAASAPPFLNPSDFVTILEEKADGSLLNRSSRGRHAIVDRRAIILVRFRPGEAEAKPLATKLGSNKGCAPLDTSLADDEIADLQKPKTSTAPGVSRRYDHERRAGHRACVVRRKTPETRGKLRAAQVQTGTPRK